MTEFTGERVIPGQVEDNLWAEHVARYAFAARFAAGKRVLDVGCGTGYGTAELAKTALHTTGVDVAAEAIAYATEHYPGVTFRTAHAGKLPFDVASFDLITAFELIEHLDDWRAMLHQVRHVLDRAGVFIVSTPNKLYYAASRGETGPNPYHRHEFEYAEFRSALSEFFPHVRVLLQDRMESFGFYDPGGVEKVEARITRASGTGAEANFFVAVCSVRAQQKGTAYLYVPNAANLLRERETHIGKLQSELAQVRRWLEATTSERDQMVAKHAALEEHLEGKNRWAAELDGTLKAAQSRIVELQQQFRAEQAQSVETIALLDATLKAEQTQAAQAIALLEATLKADQSRALETITGLEGTLVERNAWAAELDVTLKAVQARVVELQEQFRAEQTRALKTITDLEGTVAERTAWAAELAALLTAAQSRIVELQEQIQAEQTRALAAITGLEATVVERTEWAQSLGKQVQALNGELKALTTQAAELASLLALVRESRWVKAGRMLGLGPDLQA